MNLWRFSGKNLHFLHDFDTRTRKQQQRDNNNSNGALENPHSGWCRTSRVHETVKEEEKTKSLKQSRTSKIHLEATVGRSVENQIVEFRPKFIAPHFLRKHGRNEKTSKKEVLLSPRKTLKSFWLKHGDIVYMTYPIRSKREVTKMRVNVETKPFGAKRTIEEMISKQVRIGRQERGGTSRPVSFCGHAANVFQSYVNNTLGFKNKVGSGGCTGADEEEEGEGGGGKERREE